jgi:hypothetical protein
MFCFFGHNCKVLSVSFLSLISEYCYSINSILYHIVSYQNRPEEIFYQNIWLRDIQDHGTQYNDTQYNDTQYNDTQHNGTQRNVTQHNDTQHNNKNVTLNI